ncbi:MAG: membrane protein insertase YidC [Nitrospirota bacterium]
MEKNAILAIALSVAVLLGFNMLVKPAPMPIKKEAPVSAESSAKGPGNVPAAPETARAAAVPAVPVAPEKEIRVDTSLYSAVFSSRGGVVKSFRLKRYKEAGEPVEMVTEKAGVLPFTVEPEGVSVQDASNFSYEADKSGLSLAGKEEGTLRLSFASPDGRTITKNLTFKDGTYIVALSVEVSGIKAYTMYMGDGFGSLTPGTGKKGYGFVGPLTLVDEQKHKDNPAKLEGLKVYTGKTGWTAVTDKYFLAAAIPVDGIKAVILKGLSPWGMVGLEEPADGGIPKHEDFLVYIGPKELDMLKAAGHDLDRAVDFGIFTIIAKPLFIALKFFYNIVGNYGWAIIIITVIIKLLFAPLTHKSQKSMKKMQKLQPLFAELKEKYKGDPARLNREMMELYKKHKVNPMGGCLPMVIQIPVFIALYNVLNNAIDLRQAPFAFWLHDLSAKDPYYVLPILMGLSMLVMQKMTPTSMDPKQNMMMMLMPLFLTFMFINLPSGLVLYFTVSNLLSMAQQFYINKYSSD